MAQLGDVLPLPASVRPDPAANFPLTSDVAVSAPPGLEAGWGAHPPGPAAGLLPFRRRDDGKIRILREGTEKNGSYRLDITADGVTLRAPSDEGLFAGMQTIRQLLPHPDEPQFLPGGRIEDEPRFAYRGTMLDLARHFFTPAELKRYIDTIAQFKINYLHLHLTDDQGW